MNRKATGQTAASQEDAVPIPRGSTEILHVVMYHYVRDLPNSPFPRIKGLPLDDFDRQLKYLRSQYEMASLESALALLSGNYHPQRPLCLLTFDDGLKEHYQEVFPRLAEHGIQGLFFLITSCLSQNRVVSVHKNHFLMALLEFREYRDAFIRQLAARDITIGSNLDANQIRRTYRWDTPEVAEFKYLLNFQLGESVRDEMLNCLFEEYLGSESEFAEQLYLDWEEARGMQEAGMLMGGHSHRHRPLAKMREDDLRWELDTCTELLLGNLLQQSVWPFSYPYGKPGDAFDGVTVSHVRRCGYTCGFSTEVGSNQAGQDRFGIRRIDTKDITLSDGRP